MFKNKVVNTIAWICWLLSTAYLIFAGVTEEDFKGILLLLLGIVDGAVLLYKAIKALIDRTKTKA